MTDRASNRPAGIVRTNEVIGYKVINREKENLGNVYELALDKLSGQVIYVVLETGAFLGMGGKLLALPWNALNYDPDEDAFVVGISKEKINQASGFDKDHWPDMANKEWATKIFEFYGTKPYFD